MSTQVDLKRPHLMSSIIIVSTVGDKWLLREPLSPAELLNELGDGGQVARGELGCAHRQVEDPAFAQCSKLAEFLKSLAGGLVIRDEEGRGDPEVPGYCLKDRKARLGSRSREQRRQVLRRDEAAARLPVDRARDVAQGRGAAVIAGRPGRPQLIEPPCDQAVRCGRWLTHAYIVPHPP